MDKHFKHFWIKLIIFNLFFTGTFCLIRNSNFSTAAISQRDFVLDWNTNSYVPPDYQGKALPTRGSQVTVAAIPTKKLTIPPEKMYFRWFLDGKKQGYASGQGKDSLTFYVTKWPEEYHEVEMQITDENGNLLNSYTIDIPVVEPETILVKNDGLAIKEELITSTGQTINLKAKPFFFSIKKPLEELSFNWIFEDQELANPDNSDPDLLVLTIPQGKLKEVLIRNLKLVAKNKKNNSQTSLTNITLKIR